MVKLLSFVGALVLQAPRALDSGEDIAISTAPAGGGAALPAPGLYKAEPYSALVLVPGPHPDEAMVIRPAPGPEMKIITPEVRLIPRRMADE